MQTPWGMQTHWVQGDDPGGRPGRPAGEPGRRELSAGAPGRAVPCGETLADTQLDHTHLAVQHRHFGWNIMLV